MLSIILLTLAVTVATAPLTLIAMRSQQRLARLAPELATLRRRFAADRPQLNRETAALFKANGVSPVGGCLPVVIQAPIFIAMFRHVRHVAAAGGLSFGRMDLAQTGIAALQAGPHASAFVLVVLLVTIGSGVVQARMSRSATATAARTPAERVAQLAPVVFGGWALALPLAVGVYYATSSVLRLALQWGVTRHLSA